MPTSTLDGNQRLKGKRTDQVLPMDCDRCPYGTTMPYLGTRQQHGISAMHWVKRPGQRQEARHRVHQSTCGFYTFALDKLTRFLQPFSDHIGLRCSLGINGGTAEAFQARGGVTDRLWGIGDIVKVLED
jgi:hypothetical protein